MSHTYDFPRPSVTVDLVVLGRKATMRDPYVLLVRRGKAPYANRLALPGGFLEMDETSADAAARELREETGFVTEMEPTFLGVWDRPDRDPRGRVITLAYGASLPVTAELPWVEGRDDAASAEWVPVHSPEINGTLAFDHDEVLDAALVRLGFVRQAERRQLARRPR